MLNAVLHQPVRTRIVAYLKARGESTFVELKTALESSDGNLEAHMKKLTEAGYVAVRKVSGRGRPKTFYELTSSGKAAFHEYVAALNSLLNLAGYK
jgi:predicted ArsR family transcriptional regulator